MVGTDLAIGLVVLSLLFVHGREQLWLLYVVAFLYGIAADLAGAAQSALLRLLLPQELLAEANGALQMLTQGMRIVAPLAGAGIYAVAGGGVVAVLDAATFVIAAGTLVALRVDDPKPQPGEASIRAELAAGMLHIARTPALRQIVGGAAVAMLVIGFSETVIFTVLDQGLHRPPSFLGVLDALQGAGSIVGGLTAAGLLRRIGDTRLVGVGLGLFAAGDLMLLVPHLATVLVGFAIAGAGIMWAIVGFMTALQTRSPLDVQGRVSGAASVALALPQTLSIATGAALSTVVDYRVLLVAMGVVTIGSGSWLATRESTDVPLAVADASG
jgi:MFS family permease